MLSGVGSPPWHQAAAGIDALLARLVDALPGDAALLVTADHGGLNVAADGRVDLDLDPRLLAGLRVVAGEPRVRYLHTEPGAAADVQAAWTEVAAGWADVYSREQAVATGMFGPVSPAHLARIGDVVVVCTGDAAVLATGHEPPEMARLVGFHGAASDVEMAIPLIVFTRPGGRRTHTRTGSVFTARFKCRLVRSGHCDMWGRRQDSAMAVGHRDGRGA